MDRVSRSELQRTVDEQQEKLTKYQTKLRDVLAAYKGVLKEKEALESTLQALSNTGQASNNKSADKTENNEGSDEEATGDALSAKGDESNQLREQLATLTSSLATLTLEKSKMEANYQAEKKLLRQEFEEKMNLLEEEQSEIQGNFESLNKQHTEMKTRLRTQQHEHDKEQSNQSVMLKELQQMVSVERMIKEQFENQVEELKFELEEQKKISNISQDRELEVKDLAKQIGKLKLHLVEAEGKHEQPTQDLEILKKELEQLSSDHNRLLSQEQQRTTLAQQQLQQFSGSSEGRISQLEAKISQLSAVIGDYERQRVQDEQLTAKLRERINQLDLENTALAKTNVQVQQGLPSSEVSDLPHIMEQFIDILSQLRSACRDSDRTAEDVLNELGLYELSDELHTNCRQELEGVKEEFERYKLRAQSVLKSKNTKDPVNKEIEGLKCQVAEYKEKLWQLRAEKEDQESEHREKLESLSKTLVAVQDKHKQELASQESESKLKMAELDGEMKRHRDRTIALLAEKDKEITSIRSRMAESPFSSMYRQSSPPYRHTSPFRSSLSSSQELFEAGASSELEQQQNIAVTELLSRSSVLSGTPGETSLLHFAEEQARKEVEIQSLHRQKHALETALRDLNHSSASKEQHLIEQVDFLKEEVRKNQRNISRESANLEYLKNVVFHYMVCTDSIGKQQMLNAISTILQFSPKEKQAVHEQISQSWFSKKK